MEETELAELDKSGYGVLDAIAHVREPANASAYKPHLFVCMDGRSYWVKHGSQQGLVAELVAGRLAAQLTAGPEAKVIRVPKEAIERTSASGDFVGVHVGSLDVPNAVNARDLATVGLEQVPAGTIQPEDRALVVVFQTWIGVGDSQVLIDLATGRLFSIDHGDVFANTATLDDPQPIVTEVPGVAADHGCQASCVVKAVERVESLSDGDLLRNVASVPVGTSWRSERPRRLQIARWLAYRRDYLREKMKLWS